MVSYLWRFRIGHLRTAKLTIKTQDSHSMCFLFHMFHVQLFHGNWRKRGARKTTTLGPSRGCPFHSFHRQSSLPFKSSSGFEMFESGSRINWDILVNICSFNVPTCRIAFVDVDFIWWFQFYFQISFTPRSKTSKHSHPRKDRGISCESRVWLSASLAHRFRSPSFTIFSAP